MNYRRDKVLCWFFVWWWPAFVELLVAGVPAGGGEERGKGVNGSRDARESEDTTVPYLPI